MKVMLILLGQDEASFDNLTHVQLIGGLQGKELRDKWRVIAKQKQVELLLSLREVAEMEGDMHADNLSDDMSEYDEEN